MLEIMKNGSGENESGWPCVLHRGEVDSVRDFTIISNTGVKWKELS